MLRACLRKLPWIMIVVFICSCVFVEGRLPWWSRAIGILCALLLAYTMLTEK